MNNVMIDLETLGINPDCAFISIGACFFDLNTGIIGNTFYYRIDWESAMKGRSISASTLKWWFSQDKAAVQEILKEGTQLADVLNELRHFLGSGAIVWGNGATFDISILQNAYNNDTPWKFYNVRDVRTIVSLAKDIGITRSQFRFEGTPHNALDDAVNQAVYVSAMYKALTGDKK